MPGELSASITTVPMPVQFTAWIVVEAAATMSITPILLRSATPAGPELPTTRSNVVVGVPLTKSPLVRVPPKPTVPLMIYDDPFVGTLIVSWPVVRLKSCTVSVRGTEADGMLVCEASGGMLRVTVSFSPVRPEFGVLVSVTGMIASPLEEIVTVPLS